MLNQNSVSDKFQGQIFTHILTSGNKNVYIQITLSIVISRKVLDVKLLPNKKKISGLKMLINH